MQTRNSIIEAVNRQTDTDLHDQILHLEAEIEELTERVERCQKIIWAAKVAIVAGAMWLLAIAVGIKSDPTSMIGAIAVVIGGIVVFGSNTSTSKQATVAIKTAEMLRAELIDKTNPRVVPEGDGLEF